jgi:hypothetical protein
VGLAPRNAFGAAAFWVAAPRTKCPPRGLARRPPAKSVDKQESLNNLRGAIQQTPAAPRYRPTNMTGAWQGTKLPSSVLQCPTPAEVAASDRDLALTFESDPTTGQTVCPAAQSSRDLTLLEARCERLS